MVLERLDNIEVGSLTLRETVLAVQLQLSSDNRVLTPAVHIEGSLGKDECTGIRKTGSSNSDTGRGKRNFKRSRSPLGTSANIGGTGHLEKTRGIDEGILTGSLTRSTECMESIRKSIKRIGIVERLGTKSTVEGRRTIKGRAIINIGIRLNNPDELLNRVVEVELDLIGRLTDRLVTSELNLLNEVLVGVLGHLSALIGIKEDIVNIERSSNKRLLVGNRGSLGAGSTSKAINSPEALTNRAKIEVNLDFVVLYEPLIPPLSGYLSALLYSINSVTI